MNEIAKLPKPIGECVLPTFKVYEPLLRDKASVIKATKRETFTYGDHGRQTLDIYYPTNRRRASITQLSEPVLVFVHGGGLVSGSKTIPNYADGLAHANVGHFFAERTGYTTIIPDYRLMTHGARYPSGGDDVARVVDWVREHLVRQEGYSDIDLFIMGNSAGGVHLSTYLFGHDFATHRAKVMSLDPEANVKLRGVVLLSVPFNFKSADATRNKVLSDYFGETDEDKFVNSPQGLLRSAKLQDPDDVLPNVGVMVLNGSLDPEDEIMVPREDFLNEWMEAAEDADEDSGQAKLTVAMMEGHNHISPPLSLGTGLENEEAWGYQVFEFLESLRY